MSTQEYQNTRAPKRQRTTKNNKKMQEDKAPKLLKNIFKERVQNFIKNFESVKLQVTADSLHDLRVSIRRLQAIFSLIRMLPHTKIKKSITKPPQTIMKPMGELRDLYIQKEIINKTFIRKNRFVNLCLAKIDKKIKKDERKTIQAIAEFPSDYIQKIDIEKILLPLADLNIPKEIKIILTNLFKDFLSYRQRADTDIKEFHKMRIALKKLRYTSEAAQAFFPGITKKMLDDKHSLQQIMGDIHDIDVIIELIRREDIGNENLISLQKVSIKKLKLIRTEMLKEWTEKLSTVLSYQKEFVIFLDMEDPLSFQSAFLLLLSDIKNGRLTKEVQDALEYGKNIHIIHPLRAALILAEELKLQDVEIIIAALLHDTLEIKGSVATKKTIENNYGSRVASIVWALTKEDLEERTVEQYLEKIKQIGESAKIVKLSDRLDSTRYLDSKNKKKQRAYWRSNITEIMPVCMDISPSYSQFFYNEFKKLWDKTDPDIKEGMEFPVCT
jgi:CHAD domain-containing protein